MQQSGWIICDRAGTEKGTFFPNASASLSSVCASCMAFFKAVFLRSLRGSYTVEASLVMAITLCCIAVLLEGVFTVHRRTAGSFLLQEALEQCVFLEDGTQKEQETGEIEKEREDCLRQFFGCGQARLKITENSTRKSGQVQCGTDMEIIVKEYEPEKTLRKWAVLQDEKQRREEGGSSLQERDES